MRCLGSVFSTLGRNVISIFSSEGPFQQNSSRWVKILTRQQIQNFEAKVNICQSTAQTKVCGAWQMNCIFFRNISFSFEEKLHSSGGLGARTRRSSKSTFYQTATNSSSSAHTTMIMAGTLLEPNAQLNLNV